MTPPAVTLLDDLQARGIILQAHGDRLRFRPREAMTPELARQVKARKRELLALVTIPPANVPQTAPVQATGPTVAGIPEGWTARRWAAELRRMAAACEAIRPNLAGEHRREAERIEATLSGGQLAGPKPGADTCPTAANAT